MSADPPTPVQVLSPVVAKRRCEWWVRLALGTVGSVVGCFVVPFFARGRVGAEFWYLGLDPSWSWLLALVWLIWGLVRAIRDRPFWTRWRALGFGAILLIFLFPIYVGLFPILFIGYPTSYADAPSLVRFRLPFDGPVTVYWGGATPWVNYHAIAPAQCRAYDLLVMVDGKSHRGDGATLEDYYCFGLPVRAPADGTVRSVLDGKPNMAPGALGGTPAGGNQIVIEVAPREFLFLCHLQFGSITVEPGERVKAGQVVARIGNSGNTSEPHLHIHLQESPNDDEGEGIPLMFHHYRSDDVVIDRGMPTGGMTRQIVENLELD
jgi:hypothetical protein